MPSEVWGSEISGPDEMLQQIPLAITAYEGPLVTFPPPLAVVVVIPEIAEVVTAGNVVKLT